jgi:hypothetical protein
MSSTTKTLESLTREVGLFHGNCNYFDLKFGQQEVKITYSLIAAPDLHHNAGFNQVGRRQHPF